MENLNEYIVLYKEQLENGKIQKAYSGLVKYTLTLKAYLSKNLADKFSFGNMSQGYMDYTYFPFFDTFLRENKLRFGIVLNHQKVRFELWLMGQNSETQKKYWNFLKTTKWNAGRVSMPQYSVLEVVLIEIPSFKDLSDLSHKIEKEVISYSEEIINYLKENYIE